MKRLGHARLAALLLHLAMQPPLTEQSSAPEDTLSMRKQFWKPSTMGSIINAPKIRIGTPTTFDPDGRRYKLSKQMLNAYQMYLSDYMEESGGILVNGTRHAVELFLVDDASSKTTAKWATEYLINEEGIRIFLGPYSSTLTRPVAGVVNASGGVQVASGSSYTDVFEGKPNVFGTLSRSTVHERGALEILGRADGGARKTLWFLTLEYDERDMSPLCAAHNIEMLNTTRFPENGERGHLVAAALDIVVKANPDILMVRVDQTLCHQIVKQVWELDFTPKAFVLLVCPAGRSFIQEVGFAGQYILHLTPWLPDLPLSGPLTGHWTARSFVDEYIRRFGDTPGYQVASAFAGVATLIRGIETADSLEPQAVADAIRDMELESIWGKVSFDSNGQCKVAMKITQYHMTDTPLLIHPCTACNGQLVYPKPNRSTVECMNTVDREVRFGYLEGRCVECPLGRQSVVIPNSTYRACVSCMEGQMGRDVRVQTCVDCFPGTFGETRGARDCTACPLGKYNWRSGRTTCFKCRAGTMTNSVGKYLCVECQEGSYQNDTGQSACVRCETGKYGDQPAATACQDCPSSLTTQGTGYSQASECGCPAGTYAHSSGCAPCGLGLMCPGFDKPVQIQPGFYAAPENFDPSRGPWKCAVEGTCPGGPPGTCSGSLTGVACSMCPEGMAADSDFNCIPCAATNSLIPIVAGLVALPALCGVYYLVNGKVVRATSVQLGCSITVGLIVTVAQVLGMLYKINVSWPQQLRPLMMGFSVLVLDGAAFGLDCLAGRSPEKQYLTVFLLPFALIGIFVVLTLVSRWLPLITRGWLAPWTTTKAFNAACSVMQALFISFAGIAAVSFQCYSHPNGEWSMLKYPSVVCFTGSHFMILVMGVLLMLTVVIPFLAISVYGSWTVYEQTQAKGITVPELEMYRFLIFRFKPMVWWWSNVFNLRQLLLGLAPMITPNDPSFQLAFIMMVMVSYAVLVARCMPWRSAELNYLDVCTTAMVTQIIVVVSSLQPASNERGTHVAILVFYVSAEVAMLAAAFVYSFGLLQLRGRLGDYGMHFPLPQDMDRFADTIHRLFGKVAKLDPEENRELIGSMCYYERVTLDNAMCILSASFDSGRGSVVYHRHGNTWSTRSKMLRMPSDKDFESRSLRPLARIEEEMAMTHVGTNQSFYSGCSGGRTKSFDDSQRQSGTGRTSELEEQVNGAEEEEAEEEEEEKTKTCSTEAEEPDGKQDKLVADAAETSEHAVILSF